MSRSTRRPAAVFGLLAALAIVLGACSSAASLPALTDPNEIITAALKASEGAKSFHLEATLDGSVNVDLTGQDGPAPSLALAGTKATADVDIAGKKAHATFTVPTFMSLTGDLIQIDQTTYVKTSLGGPLYEVQQATDSLPVDPTDTAGMFDDVGDFLSKDGVDPVKGDDVDCGGKQCYTVVIDLTADELSGLAGAAASELPVDMAGASIAATVRVEKDTYRLAGIKIVASLGEQGSLTFDLALSKWDEAVDISAPPADQVKPAS